MKVYIRPRLFTGILALFSIWSLALATSVRAQDGQSNLPPLPVNPTPIIELITAKERNSLNKAKNPKKKIEEYIKISDAHLDAALAAIKSGNSDGAERELDIYNKSLIEMTRIAFSQQKDRRKLTKKIEQRLYKQIRTLETIERMFPVDRLPFAEAALANSKRLRLESLNETFDSGDVLNVPDKGKKLKKNPADNSPSSAYRFISSSISEPRAATQIPGDYLTEEEDEMVRISQKPDERIKVFMKIADRRLIALTGTAAPPDDKKAQKKAEEEERKWGPLPKLERHELLRHYVRAIEESIVKLEDAHERNPKSSDIPRALKIMRDSTDEHLRILRSLEKEVKDDREAAALKAAIDQAEIANQGAREGLKSN